MVQYDQTAYGKVTVLKDTVGIANINPFRYKGYYYDQESGMYYCHTRYFVPEWGRWLNEDHSSKLKPKKIRDISLFIYCGNNPIMRVDYNGQDWALGWEIFKNDVKARWNRFKNNIRNFGTKFAQSLDALYNSFVFEFGVGVGYGAEVKAGPLNISLVSRTDIFSIKGDLESYCHPFGIRQVAGVGIGWGMANASWNFRDYYESFDGEQEVENSQEYGAFFGIGGSAYLGIGANIAVGFNLRQLYEDLNSIWGY